MDLNQFWKTALSEIELQISRPNFITWFKNSNILQSQEGNVTIGLPSNFAKEWVEDKYQKIILTALRNLDAGTKKVEFVIVAGRETGTGLTSVRKKTPEFTALQPFAELQLDPETNLSPHYNLNSFVVGSSNEMAYAAATAAIKHLGVKYNPLFVYGGVGVGKTHLLQACGNEVKNLYHNQAKVRYVPSEKFTNEVITAIKTKRMAEIKEKYRSVDMLVIDDIQFIGGKPTTEEEFFHTFNALYENKKQIVISSDRAPRFIPTLEERLRSRFEGGMMVDISFPDYELKMAVLRTKLQEKNSSLSDEVLSAIAVKVQKGLRELEGILNKLIFHQERKNQVVTPKLAEDIIDEFLAQPAKNFNAQMILKAVADFFEVPVVEITGKSRRHEIVEPRQITAYLLRELLNMSYPYIGEKLGKRDHTTVIHAYHKITEEMSHNSALSQKITLIRDGLEKS